jgi:hypothetical protein
MPVAENGEIRYISRLAAAQNGTWESGLRTDMESAPGVIPSLSFMKMSLRWLLNGYMVYFYTK